jgi:hypothetical protein
MKFVHNSAASHRNGNELFGLLWRRIRSHLLSSNLQMDQCLHASHVRRLAQRNPNDQLEVSSHIGISR